MIGFSLSTLDFFSAEFHCNETLDVLRVTLVQLQKCFDTFDIPGSIIN